MLFGCADWMRRVMSSVDRQYSTTTNSTNIALAGRGSDSRVLVAWVPVCVYVLAMHAV